MVNRTSLRAFAVFAALGMLTTPSAVRAQLVGDFDRGRDLAATHCVACHGADGNGPVPSFPKIAGLHKEYTIKQLQEFRTQRRVSEIMQPIAAGLSEQEIADVALFFAAQRAVPVEVVDAGVLPLGRRVYEEGNPAAGVPACAGCHGTEGRGNPRFPRLAGQYPDYTLEQMRQFAGGERRNDKRMMQAIATRLSAEETHAVAHYIASMP